MAFADHAAAEAAIHALEAVAWVDLTLTSSAGTSGYFTPGARVVADRVQLRGLVTMSGTITADASVTTRAGTTWFTLPAGQRPASVVALAMPTSSTGVIKLLIDTAGVATVVGGNLATGQTVALDGLSFAL